MANRPTEEEARAAIKTILEYIGDDPEREGLKETPARVIRAMAEHYAGYTQEPETYLSKVFEQVEGYDDLVLVSDIEIMSHC